MLNAFWDSNISIMPQQETETSDIKGIKQRSLKSIKWSAAAEVFSRAIQPVVVVILARLLSPSDFGVVAVAISVVSFAQIVQEFGLGKAIIQTEKTLEIYANNAFWMNAGIGIFLYVVFFIAAPSISNLFRSPGTINVLRVLCMQIIIVSFFTVQSALLRRDMRFKGIFFIRFTTSVIPGFVSIAMAFYGMGVWSLVYGALAGSTAQLVLYWSFSEWRPKWTFDIAVSKNMIKFSRWVMLEGLLAWIILWGDSIVIGHYLGVKELGLYRLGSTFIIFASNIFFTPIVHVALSLFSRMQLNIPELKNCYIKLTHIIISLSIPLGVGIAVLAKPIVPVFLSDKWVGTEIVIALMAIRFGIGWFVGLNSTVYTAIGRPDLNIKLLVIVTMISIPAYIFGAKYGLLIFCIVRLTISVIDNCINYFIGKQLLDLPSTYPNIVILPSLCSLLMAFVIFTLMNVISIHNLMFLIISVVGGVIFYFCCLYILNKEFVIWGYRYISQIIR